MSQNRTEELLAGLRSVAEATRLRLLFVISHGEFNVTELTQILGQSQPRVSRHLKLLCDAGLLERHREGSWVLFRAAEQGPNGALARMITDLMSSDDPMLQRDLERIEAVRAERARIAAEYFRANAADWDRIRSLHVAEAEVEAAMRHMLGTQGIGTLLDLGTGTGRVLELFGPLVRHGIGIDLSREMLGLARARLERAALRHCQVRQGDIYHLPYGNGSVDVITLHQVLHYLDEPERALMEAARVLKPEGRLLAVDFAPHELDFLRESHAHRRLGISREQFAAWAARSGLGIRRHRQLPPPASAAHGLTVSVWLAAAGEAQEDGASHAAIDEAVE